MAQQIIPISLLGARLPAGFQFGAEDAAVVLAKYFTATISTDVGFFVYTDVLPTQDKGPVLLSTNGAWYIWSETSGKYLPIPAGYNAGDVKVSYNDLDNIPAGWVVLNGRAIADIEGLSTSQKTALTKVFGLSGSLSNLTTGTPPIYKQFYVGAP